MLILKSDMLGRLSRRDHGLQWYSNIPAVIKVHLRNDPTDFFLASILILNPTYSEHEMYKCGTLHLIIIHKYKIM